MLTNKNKYGILIENPNDIEYYKHLLQLYSNEDFKTTRNDKETFIEKCIFYHIAIDFQNLSELDFSSDNLNNYLNCIENLNENNYSHYNIYLNKAISYLNDLILVNKPKK